MDVVFIFGLGILSLLPLLTSGQSCSPPTLPPGSTWEPQADCTGVKITPTQHCHCWGHCGYICTPVATTTTTTTTSPTLPQTCQPKNANGPTPLPSGATWVSAPECKFGGRPGEVLHTPKLGRCRCYGFCGYICEPPPS